MKLKSLIQNSTQLEIAEVELEFISGIPQIHFLGLPDRLIKESFYRIKSALKSAGYKFPLTSQMIVNIKPNHLRKSSRGVELAVAIGILLKTEQIPLDLIHPGWVIYGELGLDGKVYEPSDLDSAAHLFSDEVLLTGAKTNEKQSINGKVYRLLQLFEPVLQMESTQQSWQRPEKALTQYYTEDEAEFLFLAARTGLHGLLAGDSGAGKSTLARALLAFLTMPKPQERVRVQKNWRPLVDPHQSITPAAFLGGGQNLFNGEIERVQGGMLLLDELLEFHPEIIESLRGPMTGEKLRLSRASASREIESHFQVLATTNLCPCGKWTPTKNNINCRFSRLRCTRYLERLSGPILDRFGILMYTSGGKKNRQILGTHILKRIEQNEHFETDLRGKKFSSLENSNKICDEYYAALSPRRRGFLNRIAFVYALERIKNQKPKTAQDTSVFNDETDFEINSDDYNKSEKWALLPFEQLEKGMS